jgi:hypothetical protein
MVIEHPDEDPQPLASGPNTMNGSCWSNGFVMVQLGVS